MYKEGLFDRIFGGTGIQVRPQGNVDVTLGGNWQNIKNPALTQRQQKYGVLDVYKRQVLKPPIFMRRLRIVWVCTK